MSDSVRLELQGLKTLSPSLPAALSVGSRGAIESDPFLGSGVVRARSVVDLSRASRDAASAQPPAFEDAESGTVLALETGTGETLFINPETLRAAAARQGALVDGRLRLDALQPTSSTGRGLAGFLWSKVSVLELAEDALLTQAKEKAQELAEEWLGKRIQKVLIEGPSWLGARALAWVIESRLLQSPCLYRWTGAQHKPTDLQAVTKAELEAEAAEGPLLLFIHGTASNTSGGFGDLRTGSAEWESLEKTFGRRIYAYEHHTLSASPIENALHLVTSLPEGARLRIVTHSRGGLVGDLLCLHELSDDEIEAWTRVPGPGVAADELEAVTRRERELLGKLRAALASKKLVRERYVRVACPARGTLLASANLDVFLSGLLSVVGTVSGLRASGIYSGLARLVLEIAKRRMDPQVIPGIEAMLPDAPMASLLARASRAPGLQVSVIAGDIEGGGIWQRLGVLLADWMLFDRLDNDLVVDTDSMYEGLARDGGASALFDQGPRVNHFRYFENARTRKALAGWLVPEVPDSSDFEALPARGELARQETERRRSRAAVSRVPDGTKPVVFFLPGIMGSHLEIRKPDQKPGDGKRIWFSAFGIAVGRFADLRWIPGSDGRPLEPEALFEMFYGDLCDHLEATHHVVRFAYDWRKPIQSEAARLGLEVEQALKALGGRQPVRLLAHSMGGLVCRTLLRQRPDLWGQIVGHPGGRFVMLGTPNNGSHLLVQHLIGKAGTTRNLARIDQRNGLQRILDVAATLPGALQLLPRPGFVDTAGEQDENYFRQAPWAKFKTQVRDRWFGDHVAALPGKPILEEAARFWTEALPDNEIPGPVDRVSYVFGVDSETACGIRLGGGSEGLQVLVTAEGDGSVTWKSSRLANLPDSRHWWIPAGHGDLARTREAFAGIVELLQTGDSAGTTQGKGLKRGFPVVSRALPAKAVVFQPGPPVPANEEELAAGLFGRPRPVVRREPTARRRLAVSVTAGDLCFTQKPVICGHYQDDPIAGAEDVLDRQVLKGGLRQRERLGFYANEIGSSAVALVPGTVQEGRRSPLLGALVVGLGEYGSLTSATLAETVRCGVLRLLVVLHERCAERGGGSSQDEVGLAPLLLGYNSTTHISIEDSLAAVVRGVVAANRQFAEAMPGSRLQVTELEFTELYRDTAISAAHALLALPKRLQSELAHAQVILEPAPLLRHGIGSRPRLLDAGSNSGYWPRLLVTDADDPESRGAEAGSTGSGPAAPSPTRVAQRLRYLYLSQRARAEVEVRQRQPQLIEKLVAGAIQSTQYDPELSRLFFQLMVPLDFKEPARLAERLLLVVDGATANFPWEMLVAEDEPVVVRTQLIRQLASTRYRAQIKQASNQSAFVVGNPSTEGFGSVFPVEDPKLQNRLPPLHGAAKEAELVAGILRGEGFDVLSAGTWPEARSVLEGLFCRPHRILHIAAHGLFGYLGKDGQPRTGVVLSDGLILSAVEIGQLERVPELVFLNCCHLGTADALPRETSKIAYSLARELIEAGVRCVIAAGWEVDDAAAELFARTFYTALITDGRNFAEAVLEGRKRVWEEMRDCNTWGAYQAYGDPAYRVGRAVDGTGPRKERAWVSPLELEAEIGQLTLRASRRGDGPVSVTQGDLDRLLASAPASFVDLAEVQEAVGQFESELGNFAAASAAYLKAIRVAGGWGGLTVRAVEQLANLEARQGEKTGDLKLVESAVRRLEGLLGLAPGETPPAGAGAASPANPERLALLASAEKRRAAVLLRTAADATACKTALERARDFYRAGMGSVDGPEFNGYLATNYLQLAALTGTSDPAAAQVAARASDLANAEFARNPEFFTAIIPVDARLTVAWMEGRLVAEAASLVQAYRDAAQLVPASARKWDSVTRQLKLLVDFGRGLAMAPGDLQALDRICRDLGGTAEPKPASPPPAPPGESRTAAKSPRTTAKRSSPSKQSRTRRGNR